MKIAIGAGHNPPKDFGCIYQDFTEYDWNLKVAIQSQIELSKTNHTYYDFKGTLPEKTKYINSINADIAIEIHHNCNINSDIKGTEIIYHPESIKGKLLAEKIMRTFYLYPEFRINLKEGYYRYDPTRGYFYFLSHTKMPAIILECAYLTNETDRQLMLKSNYKNNIAKALIGGIENYVET
jgi:N-acetylmuramoyl-L-alanine amidase